MYIFKNFIIIFLLLVFSGCVTDDSNLNSQSNFNRVDFNTAQSAANRGDKKAAEQNVIDSKAVLMMLYLSPNTNSFNIIKGLYWYLDSAKQSIID